MQAPEQKPKLLFLITKSNFGGAQKYVFDLATSEKINNEFDVSVALGGNGELVQKLKDKNIKVLQLKHIKNTLNPIKAVKIFNEVNKLLKKEKFDVLHINSSIAGAIGTLAGRLNKNKIVFTAHGWPHNEDRPAWQKKIFKIIENIVIKSTHKNIAVSKQIILDADKKLANKFDLIYLGIENINFKDLPENISKNFDKNKINILSIGELHPTKNHKIVINTLANINNKNIHYHIFGDGHIRSNLEKTIVDLKLEKHVTLHGNIKDAKNYINNFDIFVMPSITEALGYALLEASQSNAEIIVSDAGGMKEVVEITKKGEIFKSNNQKDLEKKLENIIRKINERRAGGAAHGNNINIASEKNNHFPLDKMIEKTLEIYKKLL